jgi:hypothetical protein
MKIEELQKVARELERQVEISLARGYENAGNVLTSEIVELLPSIYDGSISLPVKLKYTAGPHRNFTETKLGECHDLESAWANFRATIEDWDSSPAYRSIKAKYFK